MIRGTEGSYFPGSGPSITHFSRRVKWFRKLRELREKKIISRGNAAARKSKSDKIDGSSFDSRYSRSKAIKGKFYTLAVVVLCRFITDIRTVYVDEVKMRGS